MATARRPRLTPVAAPTDPFVRPGIAGPDLQNFDFRALGRFSATLQRYAEFQERQQARAEAEADKAAPDAAAALALAQERGTVTDDEVAFLGGDDETTENNLEVLKKAGVQDIDNPYLVLALRREMGRRRVRDGGYKQWMSDTEFSGQYAAMLAASDPEAEGFYQDRRDAWIQQQGEISGTQQIPFSSEIVKVDEELRPGFSRMREQTFNQERELTMANRVTELAEQAGDPTKTAYERYQAVTHLRQWVNTETKITGDRAKVLASLTRTMRTQAEQLAMNAPSGSADTFLDAFEDEFGDGTTAKPILEARQAVESIKRQRRIHNDNSRSDAVFAIKGRINQALTGYSGDLKSFFSTDGGEAAQIAAQVAKEMGVDLDPLLGALVDLEGDFRRRRALQVNDSDPESLSAAQKAAREGDDRLLQTFLLRSDISEPDKQALVEQREKTRSIGADKQPAKEGIARTRQRALAALGPLAENSDSLALEAQLSDTIADAYRTSLEAKPGDFEAASIAAFEAARRSPAYEGLQEFRQSLNPSYWAGAPLDKILKPELDRRLKLATIRLGNLDEEGQQRGLDAAYAENEAYRQAAIQEIREIVQTPEWRRAPSDADRELLLENRLGEVRGLLKAKAARGETAANESDRKAIGLSRIQRLYNQTKPEPQDLIRITGGDLDSSASIYRSAQSAIRRFLAAAVDENPIEPAFLASARSYLPQLELAASARLQRKAESLDSLQDRLLAEFGTETEAMEALRAMAMFRGLTPKEVIGGVTQYGVPLYRVFGGPNYLDNFPLKYVPIYVDEESINEAQKLVTDDPESEPGLVMKALRMDPTDKQQVEAFFEGQKSIVNTRPKLGVRTTAGWVPPITTYRRPLKVEASDTTWAKAIKRNAIQ